jgi:hypothetical protein
MAAPRGQQLAGRLAVQRCLHARVRQRLGRWQALEAGDAGADGGGAQRQLHERARHGGRPGRQLLVHLQQGRGRRSGRLGA